MTLNSDLDIRMERGLVRVKLKSCQVFKSKLISFESYRPDRHTDTQTALLELV